MIGMDLVYLLLFVGVLRGSVAILEEWLDARAARQARH
jgi:hypothetical protein